MQGYITLVKCLKIGPFLFNMYAGEKWIQKGEGVNDRNA